MTNEGALRVARRRAAADEWALVLAAEGLHPAIRDDREGFAVSVPPDETERARAVLEAWERENEGAAAPRAPVERALDPGALGHALAVAAALLVAFMVTGPAAPGVPLFERGSADAARLLGGEPWRAVTALALHADWPHALGNALAGALFLAGVFHAFGFGVGGASVLATGLLGNLLNAWAHGRGHASVGASTAVFGAVGLLAGRTAVRRRAGIAAGRPGARFQRAAWLPLAAALALLAMLGSEGERTDLWAHGFGLASGLGLGALLACQSAALERPALQRAAGATALAVLAGAWTLALAH